MDPAATLDRLRPNVRRQEAHRVHDLVARVVASLLCLEVEVAEQPTHADQGGRIGHDPPLTFELDGEDLVAVDSHESACYLAVAGLVEVRDRPVAMGEHPAMNASQVVVLRHERRREVLTSTKPEAAPVGRRDRDPQGHPPEVVYIVVRSRVSLETIEEVGREHSQIATTADVYAHLTPAMLERTAARMDGVLLRRKRVAGA